MAKMKWYDWTAFILLDVAAINWGATKIAQYNIVDHLLSFSPTVATIVYALVGLAGLYGLFTIGKLASR